MNARRVYLQIVLAMGFQAAACSGQPVQNRRWEVSRGRRHEQADRPLLSGPPAVQLNAIGRAPLAAIVQLQTSRRLAWNWRSATVIAVGDSRRSRWSARINCRC